MVEVHRTFAAPERIGAEMIGIPAGGEIEFDLRLESVSEGVLVTGTVSAATEGQCGRCLEPLGDEVDVFLTELFAYPDSATEQTTDEEDVARLIDDEVDLEQFVIDLVGTELPLSPVCDADCPGLCVECGVRLADAEPDHGHDIIDPRWAALADKLKGDGVKSDGEEQA
ncbi:YceD family protein [Gordonia sp. PP30]|uniref:YceD family protein n=1 Tax=Gordonia sp. PP30 TaxID=2935861 RepID=UPI001FFF0EF8|nr:YceD family protein [Gordonia sp. PP30]UQE77005.1 YceD family protein [Gordonia sp. PP30]